MFFNLNHSVKSFCRKVRNYFQYFVIVQGLTAYWYDENQNGFQRNTLSRVVVFVAHSVGLVFLVYILIDSLELFENTEDLNPVMVIMSGYKYVQGVMIVYTIIHIWRYDMACFELKSWILLLEKEVNHNMNECQGWKYKFEYLMYLKYGILFYIYLANMLLSYNSLPWQFSLWDVPLIVCFANLQMLPYLVLYQYFEIFFKICRCFCHIEMNVIAMAEKKLLGVENDTTSRHCELQRLHSKLCRVLGELKSIFQLELLVCRSNIIMCNLAAAYFAFLFILYIRETMAILGLVAVTYFFNTLDLYINDYMCDMTSSSFGDLNSSLKGFNVLQSVTGSVEKAVSFGTSKCFVCFVSSFELKVISIENLKLL